MNISCLQRVVNALRAVGIQELKSTLAAFK
jgi:hypothetical protein